MATSEVQNKINIVRNMTRGIEDSLEKSAARGTDMLGLDFAPFEGEIVLVALKVYRNVLNGREGRLKEIDRIAGDLKGGSIFTATRREALVECTIELAALNEVLEVNG